MKPLSGHSGPGPGPYWDGSRPTSGLIHGFFHNLCTAICSCCYVFSCCWLIEDCLSGQRSFPEQNYGPLEPAPPPPVIGHQHYGPSGSVFGGYPGEPPPYR